MNQPALRVFNPFTRTTEGIKTMTLLWETNLYTSLQWQNCYNGAGEFEIHMPYSQKAFELFSPFHIVHIDRPVREPFGIIVYENVLINEQGHKELTVKGKMLSCVLSFRGMRTDGYTSPVPCKPVTLIRALIDANVRVPGGGNYLLSFLGKRVSIGNLATSNYSLIPYDYTLTGETLYDEIVTLCNSYDIGFYVSIDTSNMQLQFTTFDYKTNSNIVFSIELGNVINMNLSKSIDNLVNGYFFNAGNLTLHTHGINGAEDIRRIERRVDVPFTDTTDFYSASMTYCRDKLANHYMSQELEADVSQTNKFYTKDYNIGDIVKLELPELGISTTYPITSVREIWEEDYKIEVGFGKLMLTAFQKMKMGVV